MAATPAFAGCLARKSHWRINQLEDQQTLTSCNALLASWLGKASTSMEALYVAATEAGNDVGAIVERLYNMSVKPINTFALPEDHDSEECDSTVTSIESRDDAAIENGSLGALKRSIEKMEDEQSSISARWQKLESSVSGLRDAIKQTACCICGEAVCELRGASPTNIALEGMDRKGVLIRCGNRHPTCSSCYLTTFENNYEALCCESTEDCAAFMKCRHSGCSAPMPLLGTRLTVASKCNMKVVRTSKERMTHERWLGQCCICFKSDMRLLNVGCPNNHICICQGCDDERMASYNRGTVSSGNCPKCRGPAPKKATPFFASGNEDDM